MKHYFHRNRRAGISIAGSTCFPGSLLIPFMCVLAILTTGSTFAVDTENCLMCHRFRGLARVDKDGTYRLFYVDEDLFGKGPHARVSCTGCHVDIDKIPHDDAKPVDCIRNCHIEEPTREIIFTHEKVKKSLQDSVHATVDKDGNPLEFHEDYPDCKDCHDMPLFRPLSMFKSVRSGVSERAVSRCMVCHSDENFIRYYYSHVTTRLHKARDSREVVNMCATCHGDTETAKRHNLPDVVSSYLETFHGKAVLFGSTKAPDCLDCHARQGSVHEMHAKDDSRSSVYPQNRPLTCSTADCHSSAAPALASFDVHATRKASTHPLEFTVAFLFVVMTLAILLPILTMNLLGYIRELFPSHHAEEEIERLTKLAAEKGDENGRIKRFSGLLRFQHAFLVVTFVILCMTGFPLKFAQESWAPVILDMFGGINGAPIIHRIAGVSMLVGFAIHILTILIDVIKQMKKENKHGLKSFIKEILALPMIPKPRDLKALIQMAKYVTFLSPVKPGYDRYSWKEKLEYLGLFWGIPLLGVTGALLWAESISSHILPGWLLNIAYLAHTYESILAAAHIALVHIPGVIGLPGLTPFAAMVLDGKISAKVQAEEHGGEIENWYSADTQAEEAVS